MSISRVWFNSTLYERESKNKPRVHYWQQSLFQSEENFEAMSGSFVCLKHKEMRKRLLVKVMQRIEMVGKHHLQPDPNTTKTEKGRIKGRIARTLGHPRMQLLSLVGNIALFKMKVNNPVNTCKARHGTAWHCTIGHGTVRNDMA